MVDAATQIADRLKARIVLVGSAVERESLERAAQAFATSPRLLTADAGGLAALARELAGAAGYLGIDSGLAHLAAAYGIPGVTVYGGGTWPAYAPWRPGSAGVVAPIPCFGCGWDCAFERAFCLEGVDVAAVVAAFLRAREAGMGPQVVERDAYGERERAILAAAAGVHRATQADRAARLVTITRVRDVLRRYSARARARERRVAAHLTRLTTAAEQAAILLGRSKSDP
jgi:hypothetical protein